VLIAGRPVAAVSSEPPHAANACDIWLAMVAGPTMLADRIRLDVHGQPPARADVTAAAAPLRSGS